MLVAVGLMGAGRHLYREAAIAPHRELVRAKTLDYMRQVEEARRASGRAGYGAMIPGSLDDGESIDLVGALQPSQGLFPALSAACASASRADCGLTDAMPPEAQLRGMRQASSPVRRPFAGRRRTLYGMTAISIQETTNKKNLRLLIMLRWLAVGGQIVTIAIVHAWFGNHFAAL